MKRQEEMVTSLYAISIVAKKLARELLSEKGEKDVKDKATDGSKRGCTESYI